MSREVSRVSRETSERLCYPLVDLAVPIYELAVLSVLPKMAVPSAVPLTERTHQERYSTDKFRHVVSSYY